MVSAYVSLKKHMRKTLSLGYNCIGSFHTLYLSFLLHRQDFRKPNFTPKKTTKGTKNTKNVSEKVKYMHFFHSIWKNLHLTENFYTDMSVVSVTNKRYGSFTFSRLLNENTDRVLSPMKLHKAAGTTRSRSNTI